MPALAIPPDAVPDQKETIVRPLMENAFVVQIVISIMTAVKIPTVPQVVNNILYIIIYILPRVQ